MTYFHNITSLSELKKQYRELVKNNHRFDKLIKS